jgi:hypothetical protein
MAALEPRFNGLPMRQYINGLRIMEARTALSRTLGLSLMDSLDADHALHIPKCSSIHMFGMRFPLDLVWLARDGTVVRIDRDVQRNRIRHCSGAKSVIETLAGRGDAFASAWVAGV